MNACWHLIKDEWQKSFQKDLQDAFNFFLVAIRVNYLSLSLKEAVFMLGNNFLLQ